MDPDANLKEMLELAQKLVEFDDKGMVKLFCRGSNADEYNIPALIHDGERLAELVEALDSWLRNGGFLPERWNGAK